MEVEIMNALHLMSFYKRALWQRFFFMLKEYQIQIILIKFDF